MRSNIESATCPFCGELIGAEVVDCPRCGNYLGEDGQMVGETKISPVVGWLVPIGRSGWAIASGYLALFAVIPILGIPFSILALVTGLLAVRSISPNRGTTGLGRAWFGIVVGGITLVLELLLVIAMIARR